MLYGSDEKILKDLKIKTLLLETFLSLNLNDYVGKVCIFSNDIADFLNPINSIYQGKLKLIEEDEPLFKYKAFNRTWRYAFPLCVLTDLKQKLK